MTNLLASTPGWENAGADPDGDYHRLRVHALLVIGSGEGDRWLDAAVRWLAPHVDTVTLYMDGAVDDATTDTAMVLQRPAPEGVGATVWYRPIDSPSFLDHEARFRAGAWSAWQELAQPAEGDWVFVPDADEFPVPRQAAVPLGSAIRASARFADLNGQRAVAVPIPEVWAKAPDGTPMVRTDGRWAGNAGPRLVRWSADLDAASPDAWLDNPMGCGSVPVAATSVNHTDDYGPAFFQLLHYGYAHPDDVAAKAARYRGLADHGHADDHIASITRPPALAPISGIGCHPTAYRGHRS